MSLFAGSAIAQGPYVGRIDCWSEWKPTSEEPLWLLLSGATDPPKEIGISKRRTRDAQGDRNGAFLAGVTRDLVNMEDVVGTKLFNNVKDFYLTKDAASKQRPSLCYTILGMVRLVLETGALRMGQSVSKKFLTWCLCLAKGLSTFHCLAACPEYSMALDTKGVYVSHDL